MQNDILRSALHWACGIGDMRLSASALFTRSYSSARLVDSQRWLEDIWFSLQQFFVRTQLQQLRRFASVGVCVLSMNTFNDILADRRNEILRNKWRQDKKTKRKYDQTHHQISVAKNQFETAVTLCATCVGIFL